MGPLCIATLKDTNFEIKFNLKSIPFYKRSLHKELLTFFINEVIFKNNGPFIGKRNHFDHPELEYVFFVHMKDKDAGSVLVTMKDFPMRVAFEILQKCLIESFTEFEIYFKDVKELDKITRVKSELIEAKVTLHETIDKLLERGARLDDLVERTELLSVESKTFFKASKGVNRSCLSCPFL